MEYEITVTIITRHTHVVKGSDMVKAMDNLLKDTSWHHRGHKSVFSSPPDKIEQTHMEISGIKEREKKPMKTFKCLDIGNCFTHKGKTYTKLASRDCRDGSQFNSFCFTTNQKRMLDTAAIVIKL